MNMDAYQVLIIVIIQIHQLPFLPISQRTNHILFRIIKSVSHIGYTGSLMRIHHAEQIKIDLYLGIIGIRHIFVNK